MISLVFIIIVIILGRNSQVFISKSDEEKQNELIETIKINDYETVKELIDKKYDYQFITSEGFTPLETALYSQSIESAYVLLEEGAQIKDSDISLIAKAISTMDDFIQYQENKDYQKMLYPYEKFIKLVFEIYPDDLNKVDENGDSALHHAASKGIPNIIQLLIDLGIDVKKQNKSKENALMLAVKTGHADATAKLLKYSNGVKDNDLEGNTPLILAAMNGDHQIVEMLCEYEGEIDLVNSQGKTALMYSAEYGYPIVVELLLKRGANSSLKSKEGKTAIDYAKDWGHSEIVTLLQN